ncbi:hypothetical protein [Jeotgalibacillus aurantiacus]|uniref:hypothetical protein n=1 Tax=Jeotgalibacillus aurantiacus TaxID=2763266 RepID=UPI001D0B759A|nr:hypothetical protein [Jeotgalibacillus aurantiacus]
MKRYVWFMTAALALAACSDDQAKPVEKEEVKAAEVEEVNETKKVDASKGNDSSDESNVSKETGIEVSKADEAVVPEESTAWHSKWTADGGAVFEEAVDFNQDGTDEMVIGTSTHLLVGAMTGSEWEVVYVDEVEATGFSGIMVNDTVGQMAAVTTVYEGEMDAAGDTFRLLRFSDQDSAFKVIEAYRFEGIDTGGKQADYRVTEDSLDILLNDNEVPDTSYVLQGDQLANISDEINLFDGKTLTNNEGFKNLFSAFFQTGILLGDSLETAIEKAGEGEKGYVTGSSARFYDGFTLLYRSDNEIITHVLLNGNDDLTVEQLESVIGEDIQIYTKLTDMSGEMHYSRFVYDGFPYYVEFLDKDGKVNFVSAGQSWYFSSLFGE